MRIVKEYDERKKELARRRKRRKERGKERVREAIAGKSKK